MVQYFKNEKRVIANLVIVDDFGIEKKRKEQGKEKQVCATLLERV
jgi:hypothetical protein